jgi:hypothetical protein
MDASMAEAREQRGEEQRRERGEVERVREAAAEGRARLDAGDFECPCCMRLLYEPTTTPCGHSFCRPCLAASLEHRSKCPLCRAPLHAASRLSVTTDLARLLAAAFPSESAARTAEEAEARAEAEAAERAGQIHRGLPCFVMAACLPGQQVQLHIFEPRYRLLIRRCLQGSRRFGYVPGNCTRVGTEVEITECEEAADGRFYVALKATRAFKVLSSWVTDEYMEARVWFTGPEEHEATPARAPAAPDAAAAGAGAGAAAAAPIADAAPAVATLDGAGSGASPISPASPASPASPPSPPDAAAASEAQLVVQSRRLGELMQQWLRLVDLLRYDPGGQLSARLVESLASGARSMPAENKPNGRAFWCAALLNPQRPLPSVAPGITLPVLLAEGTKERVEIVLHAVKSAISQMRDMGSNHPQVAEAARAVELDS